ncbi:hypothetical protein AB1Y20_002796 [Prymnesium parvum]|uniref:Methyltransferase domain-containing protein n=1 Tax=Prymnesium parvum TaxID=97485 RepID=A0AB34J8Z7_PRYPA
MTPRSLQLLQQLTAARASRPESHREDTGCGSGPHAPPRSRPAGGQDARAACRHGGEVDSAERRVDNAWAAVEDPQLERVRAYWERIGRAAPYWGVLTERKYAGRALPAQAAREFWLSGATEVELFEQLVVRHAGVGLDDLRRVGPFVELGCGVGRIARHMATRCHKLVCVDIAPAYIALLEENMKSMGVGNCVAVLLDQLGSLKDEELFQETGGAGFIFSLLTLQHNPPRVMKQCVRILCTLLAPGGIAILHAPCFIPNHVFRDEAVMQMNFVPRDEMERCILGSNGCVLLHATNDLDRCGGNIENTLYVIRKEEVALAPS